MRGPGGGGGGVHATHNLFILTRLGDALKILNFIKCLYVLEIYY